MFPSPPPLVVQAHALMAGFSGALWLDFTPSQVPLLVFDGVSTFLIGAEPQDPRWAPAALGWQWRGQHPALVANTCVEVEPGLLAAGVLLPSLGAVGPAGLAALLVHEAFHVWQRTHPSPAWAADELAVLTFPDTAEVLHTRAEEAHWLGEAVLNPSGTAAGHALYWRAQRDQVLPEEHQQLERRMETLEGLAQYVEQRFLGLRPHVTPDLALRSSARAWAYHSGAALAHLLSGDDWPAAVMAGESLDALLTREHPARSAPVHPALHHQAVRAAAQRQADKDGELQAFHALPGVRLRVRCDDGLVQGFDPMNVIPLAPGRWLHGRFLALGHPSGQIEVRDGQALTEGPSLFRVTRLELVGVPRPQEEALRWKVDTDAHRIDLPAGSVQAMPGGFEVTLSPPGSS